MAGLKLWSISLKVRRGAAHSRQVVATPSGILDIASAIADAENVPVEDVEILTAVEVQTGSIPLLVVPDEPEPPTGKLPPFTNLWLPADDWPRNLQWLRTYRKRLYDARWRAKQVGDEPAQRRLTARLAEVRSAMRALGAK